MNDAVGSRGGFLHSPPTMPAWTRVRVAMVMEDGPETGEGENMQQRGADKPHASAQIGQGPAAPPDTAAS